MSILPPRVAKRHRPVNTFTFPAPHRLDGNNLCGLYNARNGNIQGTYTAEGIIKICESLKSSSLTSLR